MKHLKEEVIAKTEDYIVFTLSYGDSTRYCIEYRKEFNGGPYPWYQTLEGVKEALYYHGLLESKDSPLG